MRVISDTFTLALSGGSWDAHLVGTDTRPLAPGAGDEVTVVVSVPQESTIGDMNIVTLSAASEASPVIKETLELTTVTAGDYNWSFPLVFRP
jgi:hypothetical protein